MAKAAIHPQARLMNQHADASVGYTEQQCADQHR